MFSKQLFIFIIQMVFGLSYGYSCENVRPNNTYSGLGIYRLFPETDQGYAMFNRARLQWQFTIERNGTTTQDWTIKMLPSSSKIINDHNIVDRFGLTYICEKLAPVCKGQISMDITVVQTKSGQQLVADYWIDGSLNTRTIQTDFGDNFFIMKPNPSSTQQTTSFIMIIRKDDRNEYYVLDPIKKLDSTGGEVDGQYVTCPSKDFVHYCQKPVFIDQLDDILFRSIEGIVDYSFADGSSGHLILFNIDGRPKYCFTDENKKLSDECKSSNKMKPLFEYCFPVSEPLFNGLLIIVLILIITFLALVTIIFVFCRRPISRKFRSSSNKSLGELKYSSQLDSSHQKKPSQNNNQTLEPSKRKP